MQNTVDNDPKAICMLVEVIATKSQNVPWILSVDKKTDSGQNSNDVPKSTGQVYPKRKKDLPDRLQREYMKDSYFLDGRKTGTARRLSWDAPSLTLTQQQTERCHPEESRPLMKYFRNMGLCLAVPAVRDFKF